MFPRHPDQMSQVKNAQMVKNCKTIELVKFVKIIKFVRIVKNCQPWLKLLELSTIVEKG